MRLNAGDITKLVQPGMNTHFMKAASEYTPMWNKIADFIKSDQNIETYPWLGNVPEPVEFTDERKARKISEYSLTIENGEWEQTIAIKRALLDDEAYGQLNGMAAAMGRRMVRWTDKKVFALLPGGVTATAYDGQNFFDTDHSEGNSGTQSNKSTTAFSATEFAAARAGMMILNDDQGQPVGINPNLLVVPPALEKTALETVKAVTISTGGQNVLAGLAEVLVSPWLTDTNNFYLLDTQGGEKPFILQERIALELGFQGVDSHDGFNSNTLKYGSYWRGAFGYGDWRRAWGGIVA
jgi:phage major head subunit gpT-like protein